MKLRREKIRVLGFEFEVLVCPRCGAELEFCGRRCEAAPAMLSGSEYFLWRCPRCGYEHREEYRFY